MSRSKGLRYEQLAEQYLAQRGLTPITRNYSCRGGEIDLIMRDEETLCFVEVKYRADNHSFGGAYYSIPPSKQQKIILCALHYISSRTAGQNDNYRFDVVLVSPLAEPDQFQFEWLANAFDSTGF